jgi:hypothetical protein
MVWGLAKSVRRRLFRRFRQELTRIAIAQSHCARIGNDLTRGCGG